MNETLKVGLIIDSRSIKIATRGRRVPEMIASVIYRSIGCNAENVTSTGDWA